MSKPHTEKPSHSQPAVSLRFPGVSDVLHRRLCSSSSRWSSGVWDAMNMSHFWPPTPHHTAHPQPIAAQWP